MKKFISLFCALAIVLSVNAAPVKKAHAVKFAKEQAKEVKAQKSLNKVEKTATFKPAAVQKAPAKQQFTAKHEVRKAENVSFTKAQLSANAQAAKVAKAKKEATDVTIGSWYVEDWGEDGELYLYAEDNKTVIYADLIYGGDAEDLIPGKEYTVADVYVSESTGEQYAGVFYDGEWHYGVKELSVTKTIDDNNLVHFVGSVLDSLDGAWTFHYDEEAFVPTGEVVEHAFKNIASISYFEYYAQWSVRAEDNQFGFRMDLNEKSSESPVGEYSSEEGDFDIDYTWFTVYNAAGDSAWEYKAVEAAAVISESNDSLLIAIDFLCENGVRYKATAFIADPTAQEQADFVSTDLEVDASWFDYFGVVWLDASNADATLSLTIYPEDAEDLSGEYVIANDESATASGSIKTAEGTFDLFSGNFIISKGEAGYAVSGKVLATNNVEYNLDITYVKPEPTREAELTVEGLELSFDFDAATPWWQLYGYNADSTVMVTVSPKEATEFAGNYKGEDLDPDYTYIVTDITYDEYGDFDTYNYFKLIDADLNVTYNESDSTMVITGTYVGRNLSNRSDIPAISINFSGRIPTPDVSDLTFEFAESEEGITVTPSNDEDAWDWFVVEEAIFEYYGADGVAEAIYSQYGNYYAVTGEQLLSFEEDLAYYLETSGTYYLVVWGSGEKNITTEAASFKFEFDSGLPEGCTQYDAEEGNDFIVDFAEFEIDDTYLESNGVLFIAAENENSEFISIELWLPSGASELVAGEYPVSAEEGEPQTVFAGLLSNGYLYGSYAGSVDEEGYINIPFWFFVDGKVVVNEDGSIDVDAVNCAGAAIKCHLANGEEGIEDVDAAKVATKRVVDGQLIIIKNGVKYNAQGAIVK
jgi:hypothetical protein